jgi:hypothetical protein
VDKWCSGGGTDGREIALDFAALFDESLPTRKL